jgi:peptidoglycan hydrolase-like protein with peptidoglycan-binding domain
MKRLMVLAVALCAGAAPMAARAQADYRPTYEKPLSAHAARDVQARLRALGYYGGPIDGAWGPGTRVALERFQRERRLAVTGQLNQATVTAMGLDPDRLQARGYEPVPAAPRERAVSDVGPRTTEAVQTRLRRAGYYRGPVDGVWGSGTRVALERFQREHRLPVTGAPSRDTLAALGLNPDTYMSGSSSPRSESDRLNRRELDHVERSGQF